MRKLICALGLLMLLAGCHNPPTPVQVRQQLAHRPVVSPPPPDKIEVVSYSNHVGCKPPYRNALLIKSERFPGKYEIWYYKGAWPHPMPKFQIASGEDRPD
jgi:hypothetical protein